MAFELNAAPLASLALSCLEILMAAVVLLLRPDRTRNRFPALFFFCLGLYAGTTGLLFSTTSPQDGWALGLALTLPVLWFHGAYLGFLGTLPTPVVGWLGTHVGRVTVLGLVGTLSLTVVLAPSWWQLGVTRGTETPWSVLLGPARSPFNIASLLMLLFAVGVAFSSYRHARTPVVRRQMRCYATGFGVYHVTLVALLAYSLLPVQLGGPSRFGSWFIWGVLLATLWLVAWLSYGILHTQLFDIDLKIKVGIRRGAIVGAFLFVFIVIEQLVQNAASASLGTLGGAVGAGVLLLALRPLERAADRLAEKAMPGVKDTDAYVESRKNEIFRAAVSDSMMDGSLTAKERLVLVRLANNLGLDGNEAIKLEAEVLEGGTGRTEAV
ncbi:MAG: hypothetical protein HY556_01145 [Euryarchaeota archaeon]|nr:hypothetical protein [Euryarchaeota archaeon]